MQYEVKYMYTKSKNELLASCAKLCHVYNKTTYKRTLEMSTISLRETIKRTVSSQNSILLRDP